MGSTLDDFQPIEKKMHHLNLLSIVLIGLGICIVGAAVGSAIKLRPRWIFILLSVLAIPFVAAALITHDWAKGGLSGLHLTSTNDADQKVQAEGERTADDNAQNLELSMGSAGWDAKADRVENQVTVFIPLENPSHKLVGTLLVGCRVGSPSYISIYLTLSNKYRILDLRGVKEFAFQSPEYEMGFLLYGQVAGSGDGNNNSVHIQGFSGANELIANTNKISLLKLFLRRVHKDKNFDLVLNFGEKGASRLISIKETVPTLDANNKLFEATAAYCLKSVPD
jgi:hypothetical protein